MWLTRNLSCKCVTNEKSTCKKILVSAWCLMWSYLGLNQGLPAPISIGGVRCSFSLLQPASAVIRYIPSGFWCMLRISLILFFFPFWRHAGNHRLGWLERAPSHLPWPWIYALHIRLHCASRFWFLHPDWSHHNRTFLFSCCIWCSKPTFLLKYQTPGAAAELRRFFHICGPTWAWTKDSLIMSQVL